MGVADIVFGAKAHSDALQLMHSGDSESVLYSKLQACYRCDDKMAALQVLMTFTSKGLKADAPNPAIHQAASANDMRSLRFLLGRNVDVNSMDHLGRTVGHIAARHGFDQILNAWIQSGGDLFAVDHFGEGLVHAACRGGESQIAMELLQSGAPAEGFTSHFESSLHIAVEQHLHRHVIAAICGEIADVNSPDYDGNTPLHLAVESGQPRTAVLLMECGADPTSVNNLGLTPDAVPLVDCDERSHKSAAMFVARQRWSMTLIEDQYDDAN